MSVILKGLTPQVFYHPDDLKGLKRLETIPGVKKFIADTISNLREKFTSIEMFGDGINITEDGYPELYNILYSVVQTLDRDMIPTSQ